MFNISPYILVQNNDQGMMQLVQVPQAPQLNNFENLNLMNMVANVGEATIDHHIRETEQRSNKSYDQSSNSKKKTRESKQREEKTVQTCGFWEGLVGSCVIDEPTEEENLKRYDEIKAQGWDEVKLMNLEMNDHKLLTNLAQKESQGRKGKNHKGGKGKKLVNLEQESQMMMNLGQEEVMKKIFGKANPSDDDIKAKFGSLLPDLKTIHAKVDAATLKELTGKEKPSGKEVAAAMKLMNLGEEEYRNELENLSIDNEHSWINNDLSLYYLI